MKSLQSAARRGGMISAAALSAMALAACSAGQITQTSSQVAAVDGASGGDRALGVAVENITVLIDDTTGEASMQFAVTNQDPSGQEYTLESVEVDGQEAQLESTDPIAEQCTLIADTPSHLESMPQSNSDCTQYTTVTLENQDWAFAGNLPVSFTFDHLDEPIEVTATVSAPTPEAGELDRQYDEGESTTELF
ncbi:hypothetical protein [Corynebacterium yudongzhengii]|nr:hypothetical protein [Corynebacterium yudongzhengii]